MVDEGRNTSIWVVLDVFRTFEGVAIQVDRLVSPPKDVQHKRDLPEGTKSTGRQYSTVLWRNMNHLPAIGSSDMGVKSEFFSMRHGGSCW